MFVNIDSITRFFFRGMMEGWVSQHGRGAARFVTADMPGFKGLRFEEGDFRMVDRYSSCPESPMSGGFTFIWNRNTPVWMMCYGGQYPKHVIPFLKNALLYSYSRDIFMGGRGPARYCEGTLSYTNVPELNNPVCFCGREEIVDYNFSPPKPLGFHWYHGMSLI